MDIFIGGILILWGIVLLFSSIFNMKRKEDVKDDGKLGSSGFIEWESLLKLFNKLPYPLAKILVVMIGTSFVALGAWVI
ncbi:hypothetical protein [Halobacillus salinus]|uniref:Uncharacterized protein n=1 Tax=Halobacillus salinus TaxID=192814 RepID=A0A4Z0GZ18_9BACI|nr:hypothetical protein [Halobacillus salinus]TGB03428.1 hypothetical protein E4663_00015 [Halobacillus salinus]